MRLLIDTDDFDDGIELNAVIMRAVARELRKTGARIRADARDLPGELGARERELGQQMLECGALLRRIIREVWSRT